MSIGVRMPIEECLQSRLYSSIQAATFARASALMAQCCWLHSSHPSVECRDLGSPEIVEGFAKPLPVGQR